MLSRRTLLITGGAAAIVLGAGTCSYTRARRLDAVREPWRQAAEGFGDVRLNALAYAILAPSPHNRQPWLIELTGEDSLTVYCDQDRLLPETDPPHRQVTIGFGAFLEMLRQAAAEQGYRAEITPFPEGEPYPHLDTRPVAQVRLVQDATAPRDPLFAQALSRRTVREKYDTSRPVDAAVTASLSDLSDTDGNTTLNFTSETERVAWFRDVNKRGWAAEINNLPTLHESTELTRIGSAQIRENPDGVSLSGPVIELMKTAGVLTKEEMETPGSTAFEQTQAYYDGLIDATSTFAWLTTPTNTRADQLAAGARWIRLQLAATQLGVATQPLSQVLQEFPAAAECYEEVHEVLDVPLPARIQGIFRLGYADYPPASPRWPLTSRIIT